MPFYPFLGEGSPTKIDYRKKGTLILTPLLEDLGKCISTVLMTMMVSCAYCPCCLGAPSRKVQVCGARKVFEFAWAPLFNQHTFYLVAQTHHNKVCGRCLSARICKATCHHDPGHTAYETLVLCALSTAVLDVPISYSAQFSGLRCMMLIGHAWSHNVVRGAFPKGDRVSGCP